ncbi:site-specific DNA-methyltransferase [Oscillatoria sp. FACHB-1406]|uniref:DNA-methyltransferase n=1 Tax=Oscillatoria sp. FACHB-1406 TaxID=2692846 RepID=UPI001689566F|nr:site-specific DNA-methyltransferase [Oscillatoria sp. FACHB-1406]MBD2577766.1 site-specific DNA-methyltransferase [Oscillatoria sp. FACHB-1406]
MIEQGKLWDNQIPEDIAPTFNENARVVLALGDAKEILSAAPTGFAKLIVTSPPYNLGKAYEVSTAIEEYLESLNPIVDELIRVLAPDGSLCWQVGNYVSKGEVFPLDILYYPFFKRHGLKLRNRIVWHFEHGLHAKKRLSGRYETLLWFTKGDEYTFNLDAIRVPSKYPGKRHFKGAKRGQPSGNPLGKNPGDIWRIVEQDWEAEVWNIPNVKANHPEKTIHPCQFPIELVERCVLALTEPDDWVLDPFAGVGSSIIAALGSDRRAMGCEKEEDYLEIARQRIADLKAGTLGYRPLGKPIHAPSDRDKVAQIPIEWKGAETL